MATHFLSEEQISVLAPKLAEMELRVDVKLTRQEMAEALDITVHKLNAVRESEQYKALYDRLRRKREHEADQHSRKQTLETRKKLAAYSNEAVEKLVTLMRESKDDRVKLTAACEILDRDGRFAKVSRQMQVRQGEDGAPMLPEDVGAEIMAALGAYQSKQVQ